MSKLTKQEILQNLQRKTENPKGNMVVAVIPSNIVLYSPDIDVTIKVDSERSQMQNYIKARDLMNIAIDNYLKQQDNND